MGGSGSAGEGIPPTDMQQILARLQRIVDAIDGRPEHDIKGIRPRLADVENKTDRLITIFERDKIGERVAGVETKAERLLDLVERDKMVERVRTLETVVEHMEKERTRYKAWITGLGVGLGVTTLTSLGGFALQLINLAGRGP